MVVGFYRIYGTGPGLKVKDLIDHSAPFQKAGISLIRSKVIGKSYFGDFVRLNHLNPESQPGEARNGRITPALRELNQKLLGKMQPGLPVSLNSSSSVERGGSGIYDTAFFVPTGDREKDAEKLWKKQRMVYVSEFSDKAKAYRIKHQTKMGMAIIVRPVIGEEHKGYFFPLLAGSAYTSYVGEPLVRATVGLGINAVGTDPTRAIGIRPRSMDDSFGLYQRLKRLGRVSAINLRSGELEAIRMPHLSFNLEPIFDLFLALRLAKETGGMDYSVEWAFSGLLNNNTALIQVAPYEDKPVEKMTIEVAGKNPLANGKDIVHQGKKKCKAIVLIEMFTDEDESCLKQLNLHNLKDFLLIFPQQFFSRALGNTIDYSHFSNAAVLYEQQFPLPEGEWHSRTRAGLPCIDHTAGRGGQHFQEICDREDILFMGGEWDLASLYQLGGMIEVSRGIKMWEVEAEGINDLTVGKGSIFITGDPRIVDFSRAEVFAFANDLYTAGGDAERRGEKNISGAFYNLCNVLPATGPIIGFDPYKLDLEDCNSNEVIAWIQLILAEGDMLVELKDREGRETRLVQYLRKIQAQIEAAITT